MGELRRSIGLIILFTPISSAAALDLECREFRPIIQTRQLERPEAPTCIRFGFGRFNSQSEFDFCRLDMETYQRKVRRYQDCLASEAETSIDEFNEAVRNFNERASQRY